MRTKHFIFFLLLIAFTAMVKACSKKDRGSQLTPLRLSIPEGWPEPQYTFSNNPLTQEGFDLGKKLFFDGILSKDGNFPCSSCHQPFAAFATYDHDFSHGFNNQFTTRNAPGLFNLAWHKELHWDGGINHIEVQALAPLTASNEMAETVESVVTKLNADPEYKRLFGKAFGNETISSQQMLYALTQYMTSLVSANAKYDRVMRGSERFSEAEEKGYQIFKINCASCHQEPLFTDLSFRNNGLQANPFIMDAGRMRITRLPEDSLKFKVPSLRNLMLTFPYMHDGRFRTPMQVLNHYSDGITASPTLDPSLRNGIALSAVDKFYLLEFFKTLTDTSFTADKRFIQ